MSLELQPRKDHRGVDLISDVLPFGRLWYDTPDHAIGYAMHCGRSHDAVIRVYYVAGNVIERHEHVGDFKERCVHVCAPKRGVKSNNGVTRMRHRRYFSNRDGFNLLKPITR